MWSGCCNLHGEDGMLGVELVVFSQWICWIIVLYMGRSVENWRSFFRSMSNQCSFTVRYVNVNEAPARTPFVLFFFVGKAAIEYWWEMQFGSCCFTRLGHDAYDDSEVSLKFLCKCNTLIEMNKSFTCYLKVVNCSNYLMIRCNYYTLSRWKMF